MKHRYHNILFDGLRFKLENNEQMRISQVSHYSYIIVVYSITIL